MAELRDLNHDWLFYFGDEPEAFYMGFDDRAWQRAELPHDWAVMFPFDKRHASGSGYLPGGTAWYRGRFFLTPEDCAKQMYLRFDGVYKHARVWINSNYLGAHAYGYTPFSFDVTGFVRPGENVIAVRVEHNEPADSRWYTGSGIYRGVALELRSRVCFTPESLFVHTAALTPGGARLMVSFDAPGAERVRFTLLAGEEPAAYAETAGGAGASALAVEHARLWSPDVPFLYTLLCEALSDGAATDTVRLPVGIRTARFDPDAGFFLNGAPLKLKGVCLHHDAGALGAAVPAPVWERRLRKLKAAGCNAVRTAHNPPAENFLTLCDRLGLLVMDEAFDEWEGVKNKWWQGHNVYPPKHFGYAEDFPEWHARDLRAMIARDRTHPCVILWSIGNEIDYPNDPYVTPLFREVLGNNDNGKPAEERRYDPLKPDASRLASIAAELTAIAHEADPTRPVLSAMSFPELSTRTGFSDPLDVFGYNYRESRYDEDHAAFPDRPILGSENGHDPAAWRAVTDRPFVAGQFLWTGIDFLGECRGWPERISQAGMLDLCGFEKPLYYRRKALWTDEPFIKLACSPGGAERTGVWTETFVYAAPPGGTVCVSAYTNRSEAELFLNGVSLGKKTLRPEDGCRLVWQFPYAPGEVTVTAGGCRDRLVTPGPAAAVALEPERSAPDGTVFQILAAVRDKTGGLAATDDRALTFQLAGDGRILGIENGAPDDLTPYSAPCRRTRRGRALVYVQKAAPDARLTLFVRSPEGLAARLDF